MERHHGSRTRGLSAGIAAVPQGPSFEGRFGRMFRRLPVFDVKEDDLRELADSMTQRRPTDNPNIPAGFTYLGQFVDHDITHDVSSSLQRMNDPEGLVNFRTPRFDLDSLYGRGPVETPILYDQADRDGAKLLLGRVINNEGQREENQHDLPRNDFRDPTGPQQRALIGDPRNDENTFVSQLHLLFVKFHNKVVDRVRRNRPRLRGDDLFKEAQRIVRWHYQWVVVFDFLDRTVPDGMLEKLLVKDGEGLRKVELKFYNWEKQPFMPVEFSGAAYRFGHSQVRGQYSINNTVQDVETFKPTNELPPKGDVFAFRTADFRGFRGLPPFWTVSWPFFFELEAAEVLQPSLKIDTKISGPLTDALPGADHREADARSLPRRNLLRGKALGLPSGQRVARRMGIPSEQILAGDDLGLEGELAEKFGEETPLWYYVLREAEVQQKGGERLGEVGGRIVAEVLLGLLDGDPLSFLSVEPNWTPELRGAEEGQFKMADLIRFADPDAAKVHEGLPHAQQA